MALVCGRANAAVPAYAVNVSTDPSTGMAANCGLGSANCSLRDALAAAANAGGGNITFDPAVFSAATAINLTGTLSIPSNTSVTGLTNAQGPLITLTGNDGFTIVYVDTPSHRSLPQRTGNHRWRGHKLYRRRRC